MVVLKLLLITFNHNGVTLSTLHYQFLYVRVCQPALLRTGALQVTRGGIKERERHGEDLSSFKHTPSCMVPYVWGTQQSTAPQHLFFSCSTPLLLPISLPPVKPPGDPFLTRAWVCCFLMISFSTCPESGGSREQGGSGRSSPG